MKGSFKHISRYSILSGHPDDFRNNEILSCKSVGFGRTDKFNNKDYIILGYMVTVRIVYGQKNCPLSNWETFLCSKPSMKNTCQGDSGGPLICNGYQYGVSSGTFNLAPPSGPVCGDPNTKSSFTFVYRFRDWISNIIKEPIPTVKPTVKKPKLKKKKETEKGKWKPNNAIL